MSNSTDATDVYQETQNIAPLIGLLAFAIFCAVVIILIATFRFGCDNDETVRRVSPIKQASKGNLFQVSMYMSKLHFNLLEINELCETKDDVLNGENGSTDRKNGKSACSEDLVQETNEQQGNKLNNLETIDC